MHETKKQTSVLYFILLFILTFFCITFLFGFTTKVDIPLNIHQEQVLDTIPNKAKQIKLGKRLFTFNCGTCHNKNMKDDLTGPALGGVTERWSAYPKADLYNYIRNSMTMTAEGHPRAVALYKEWQSEMSNFPKMTDEKIDAILAYINSIG